MKKSRGWCTHIHDDYIEGSHGPVGVAHGSWDASERVLLFGADDRPVVMESEYQPIGFVKRDTWRLDT